MPGMGMKRHLLLYLLVCLLFQFIARERAGAAAFTMGRFQTVSSDGSFDVLRNPSLMTLQKADNAIGVVLLYQPYYYSTYSYKFYLSEGLTSGHVGDSKYTAGSVFLSYARKIEKGAVGLGLDAGAPYQGVYNRYDRTYADAVPLAYVLTRIHGKSMKAAPRFVVSYGSMVSGKHAVGLQLSGGYSQFRDQTSYQSVINFLPYRKNHSKNKTEWFWGELSFGYTYQDADSQAGLVIRSGRLTWRRMKVHYSHVDFIAPLFYRTSIARTYFFQYDRGFSLLGGGYHKLAPFIAIALEGEFEIPVSYTEKDVKYDELTGYYGVKNSLAVAKSGLYGLRVGFEILPSGPVTISLGGGMSTTKETRKGKYFYKSVNTDTFSGTLGLDIKIAENYLIMAGSQLVYTKERTASRASYIYVATYLYDGPATLVYINIFTGVSCGF
jgi:hypothetical protein